MEAFSEAGPAEILRMTQRDQTQWEKINETISDLVLRSVGPREWIKYRDIMMAMSQILYYGLTTLSGYQTLGEEYTDIVQVDSSMRRVPSFMKRGVMIVTESLGMLYLRYVLNNVQKRLRESTEIPEDTKLRLIEHFAVLIAVLPYIQNVHHTIFYWSGRYYDISKRLLGIRYIRSKPWMRYPKSRYGFKIMACVTSLYLAFFTINSALRWKRLHEPINAKEREVATADVCGQTDRNGADRKCTLCLERCESVSCTPCGHLFCWICILEWLKSSEQCPLCREFVSPSRVVPLRNFI